MNPLIFEPKNVAPCEIRLFEDTYCNRFKET